MKKHIIGMIHLQVEPSLTCSCEYKVSMIPTGHSIYVDATIPKTQIAWEIMELLSRNICAESFNFLIVWMAANEIANHVRKA